MHHTLEIWFSKAYTIKPFLATPMSPAPEQNSNGNCEAKTGLCEALFDFPAVEEGDLELHHGDKPSLIEQVC